MTINHRCVHTQKVESISMRQLKNTAAEAYCGEDYETNNNSR